MNSRRPGPLGLSHDPIRFPSRTPGILGVNDAADPEAPARTGDTPNALGYRDHAAPPVTRSKQSASGPSKTERRRRKKPFRKSVLPVVSHYTDDALVLNELKDLGTAKGVLTGWGYWLVTFSLPAPARRTGHIIQRVQVGDIVYYEGWRVNDGRRTIDRKLEEREAEKRGQTYKNEGHDDAFGVQFETGTRGTFEQWGQVMFYEGDLPGKFYRGNVEEAGRLMSSPTPPPFWLPGKGVRRHFRCEWDLMGKEEKWRMKMEARITQRGSSITRRQTFKLTPKGFWEKLLGL